MEKHKAQIERSFTQQKRDALNNLYAAFGVGDLDLDMKPILDSINSHPDLYTTSSCGGRIVLMEELGGKGLDVFHSKWHGKVSYEEVSSRIRPCNGILWFRYECPILHVVAKEPDKASTFLHLCRESGFKRSGIQSIKDGRVLIEVLSTERIDTPIMDGGRRLVSDDYLKFLIDEANLKYEAGVVKLKRLEGKISGLKMA